MLIDAEICEQNGHRGQVLYFPKQPVVNILQLRPITTHLLLPQVRLCEVNATNQVPQGRCSAEVSVRLRLQVVRIGLFATRPWIVVHVLIQISAALDSQTVRYLFPRTQR